KLRIEKKLKEKINRGESDSPPLFNDFLSHVTFVEDNKEISTYIKTISKFRNKRSVSDEVYLRIFNEIRDKQTALKNSYIEHETISHPSEVLRFNRHIRKNEIHTLLINRIVGIDVFNFNAIPFPFLAYINDKDPEDIEDIIQECNENLSRAFFDKNASKEFWKISERIITILKNDLNTSPLMVYDKITSKIKIKTTYLTKYTLLYMTSIIITGLKNDN
ncbi:MAG: hypothetical protein ACRCZ4_06300, partial [Plesiomonas sp.]|uniref:hypothetical protein n=1 Tax=Plesiomonas sp. TaxID=2486279 RepID=UPI003F38B0E1